MLVERVCLSSDEVARYVDPDASTDRGALTEHVDRCEMCRRVVAAAVRAARLVTKPAAAGTDDAHPGDRVDRYAVFEPLGVGGMGVVYRAYDPRLDRKIALKLLRPGLCDAKNRERMQREAKMLAKLAHPNVVAVHDAHTWQDRVYIAMELVDGVTLRDWLGERERSWREIVDVLIQAGEGLASAHASGLVHRDFKPQNVLLGRDGRARVSDFGLAEDGALESDGAAPDAAVATTSLTATGAVLGTPAYMSPEQLAGGSVDATSDQFSFSIAAYEALVGERPFPAATLGELRARFAAGNPPELPSTRVPRRVTRVLLRGLAIAPAARFPSMRALVEALRRARGRSHRVVVAASVLAVVVGAGGSLWAARGGDAPSAEQRCASAAATGSAALWNPPVRAELARAFTVHGLAYARDIEVAAAARLGDYAKGWSAQYASACRATNVFGTQTAAMLDLRVACLDDKRRHVDALVKRISHLDKAQLGAVPDALAALPDLQECSDLKALSSRAPPPAHGAQAAEYDRLADELEEINVARDLGDYAMALAQAERAQPAVDALAHKSLQAKYRYIRGELLDHLGRGGEAAHILEEALYLAEAARDQETKITSLVRLYMLAGARRDQAAAERWSKLADAALAAGPAQAYARTYFLMAQGMYAYAVDDFKLAATKFEQGLALARQDPDSTLTLGLLQNLASVYYMQERDPEAKQLWNESLAYAELQYGPRHPSLAVILGNIGVFEANAGNPKQALAHFERALPIHVEVLGASHPLVGKIQLRIADVLAKEPDQAAATAKHYQAALDNFTTAYRDGHPNLTDALVAYAIFQTERKDHRAALALYKRALASEHKADAADDAAIYKVGHGLGAAHLELREHGQAIPLLERALRLRMLLASASALSLAEIERDLARAYAETGRRTDARTLATRAADRLRSAKGDFATHVAELDAFIASLRR